MGPEPDQYLYWLIHTAKRLRELQGKNAADVGFWAGDPSTVYRFESGKGWPRDPDRMVNAYAKECGLEDAREIWRLAFDMWMEKGEAPDLDGLKPAEQRSQLGPAELLEAARADFEQALVDARPAPAAKRQSPARKSSAKATRRANG